MMTQKHGCDVYDYRTDEEKAQPIADTPRWHRCNFEQRYTGIVFCDGDHERSESCLWQPLTAQHVEAMAKRLAAVDVTVPAEQIAIGADAMPADVAEALFAQHSAGWCERLIDELLALMEAAKDAERHARIWDSIEAQLRVAQ